MASSKDYLTYVLDQLSGCEGIATRTMMGEYILYYKGRIVGGIYDDRLLVKDVPSARAALQDAPLEVPYDGAKQMLLVEQVDNAAFLVQLLDAVVEECPLPKARKKKTL